MRHIITILVLVLAFLALSAVSNCASTVNVPNVTDASPDATELDADPDAPTCPSPNPGPGPCESIDACPLLPVDSCGYWDCPKNDGGQSFCTWIVKDAGP